MLAVTDASRARRLENKTAVTFGAAGDVGSAVAKELAAHGARVLLSGRTKARAAWAEAIGPDQATSEAFWRAAARPHRGKARRAEG
jgi:NAD(P)-dependent dehydrogenase (short-subunit alcohol dehydrogenase family)